MKDLRISYDNENGQRINAEYDTIMDFTGAMESNSVDIPMMDYDIMDFTGAMESHSVDIPMMDYENVEADFFENPLHHKHFNTIADLYNHCVAIMK